MPAAVMSPFSTRKRRTIASLVAPSARRVPIWRVRFVTANVPKQMPGIKEAHWYPWPYHEALRIDEAAYGPGHPRVAIRIGNVGAVQYKLGDLATAKKYQQRALKIFEKARGPDHPSLSRPLRNLGEVLHALGRHRSARAHLERAHDHLTFLRDHAPAEYRDTMVENVPLHRDIAAAWEAHGAAAPADPPRE